ncbi:MAG: hypothetical protein E6Q61_02580 [Nitrosomonas sp.]|nr:MAG: hypothetical protein E6Q61_02580 [Nitrosomonas sp.]
MGMNRFASAVLFLFISLGTEASVTLQNLNTKMSPQEKQIYVLGVASGYEWSNAFLQQEGKPPHYCVPGDLALNPKNFITIFEDQLKAHKYEAEDYAEVVMLFGLKRVFPCR